MFPAVADIIRCPTEILSGGEGEGAVEAVAAHDPAGAAMVVESSK